MMKTILYIRRKIKKSLTNSSLYLQNTLCVYTFVSINVDSLQSNRDVFTD